MDIIRKIYSPETISISEFIVYKKQKVKPIDGVNIPNIVYPPHLVSKKRSTEAEDKLVIDIRQLFNSLTMDNISLVKEQLRTVIIAKAKTSEMIREIAEEILLNFLVSEQNVKNYMHLLNAISPVCVCISASSNEVSQTIGNFFLNNCKNFIFENISEQKIRSLAQLDQYDPDDLDKYTQEREKISNLIVTLCFLYDQRNTSNIKLKATQLYPVLDTIFSNYNKIRNSMNVLGDPEDDCEDEEEYEILRKMCTIYAEQLYTFIVRSGKDYLEDDTVINNGTMASLIPRFKSEIIPTLTEAFIISKCEELKL